MGNYLYGSYSENGVDEVVDGVSRNELLSTCQNIDRDYDKFDAALNLYLSIHEDRRYKLRDIIVKYIGYAVPAPETITLIVNAFDEHKKLYPNAHLVDFGAGSGVFCWLLHRAGIHKESLIAVDLPIEKKTHMFATRYWDNIIEDEFYVIHPHDMVFYWMGNR